MAGKIYHRTHGKTKFIEQWNFAGDVYFFSLPHISYVDRNTVVIWRIKWK